MEEWMGRYRPLVSALVRHTNINTKNMSNKMRLSDEIELTHQEWQVLEYIIEHEADDDRMIFISERLGIPQSSFSKTVKALCSYDLCEKYQMSGNRKNIILKPTEKGKEIYRDNSARLKNFAFQNFFDALEPLGDREIRLFIDALNILNKGLDAPTESINKRKLIKME